MGLGITSKATRFLGALTATAVIGVGASLAAAPAAVAASPGPVQQTPALFTPWLLSSTPKQVVRQLVQCGSTMYAVGTISAVGQGSSTYTRFNVFSFNATTGAMTSWAPVANAEVHTIALSPDCSTAYLGGHFTTMNGATAKHIAAVDAVTGAVKSGFADNVNGDVLTAQYTTAHGLLIGGKFTKVNSVARTMLASVDPTTGAASAYANLAISGTYPGEQTKIFQSNISNWRHPDAGDRRVHLDRWAGPAAGRGPRPRLDGRDRRRLERNGVQRHCVNQRVVLREAAAWSPDDAPSTSPDRAPGLPALRRGGGLPVDGHRRSATCGSTTPVATRSTPLPRTRTTSTSRATSGGPTTRSAIDTAGPGALARLGLAALAPSNGLATTWNPTRSRGAGSDRALLTEPVVWIASDNGNDGSSQKCGGKFRQGRHLLPALP